MPKNKIGLHFEGFEDYMSKLDELGGASAMKEATEKALIKSKEYVNPLIEEKVKKGKLPAKGKYSHNERTRKSIDKSKKVEWQGSTGSIKIGFDFEKSGMTSIFLIYGTPKMKPVSGLKSAIYGSKTKKEIGAIQQEVIEQEIKRIMEG